MSKSICSKCNKEFRNHWTLERHVSRKFPCIPVQNSSVSRNVIQNSPSVIQNVIQNSPSVIQNVIPTNPNNNPNNNPINNITTNPINVTTNNAIIHPLYKCNYCEKYYKYRQGLCKHRLKCSHYIKEKEIRSELNISRTELTRLKDKLFQKTVSNKNNKKALKKIINNINNTTNNTNNNTTNNTTNNIQINHNIHINPLGKEDLSFITSKDKHRILKCKYDGVIELTKLVHSLPENMNFYKPNKKEDVMAYVNEEGVIQHGNYSIVSNDIINNNMNRFDILYETEGSKLNRNTRRQLDNVIYDNDHNNTQQRYQSQFGLYVMDINRQHKKEIEKIYSIEDEKGDIETIIVLKD